jgi:preprotein translocase subunit SecY
MINFIKNKVLKVAILLGLVRLVNYIPVPGVDFAIVCKILDDRVPDDGFFNLVAGLTENQFLGIGALGIIPFVGAVAGIQVCSSVIPALRRLRDGVDGGGRQEIVRYTRYLTFLLSIIFSTSLAFIFLKPEILNWNSILAFKIIFSLTTGSMFIMWIVELLEFGDRGLSLLLLFNSFGGFPVIIGDALLSLSGLSFLYKFGIIFFSFLLYFVALLGVICFQECDRTIVVVSSKKLNFNYLRKLSSGVSGENNYIPVKLCSGGAMPLIFALVGAGFFVLPLAFLLKIEVFGENALALFFFGLAVIFVIFFNICYGFSCVNPRRISKMLALVSYSIPRVRQGKDTNKYFQKLVVRLSFLGGLFLNMLFVFVFFALFFGRGLSLEVLNSGFSSVIFVSGLVDLFLVIFDRYEYG